MKIQATYNWEDLHQLSQMSRNDPDFKITTLAQPREVQGVKTSTHPLHDLRMKQYNTMAHVIIKETEYEISAPMLEDHAAQKLRQTQKNL